jgi:2,4-dienoyl-CoA reductase-like NADH-dependent reductase (Old Yellow Enzyme family)
MSALFEPFKLKDVSLRNRIAIPPMCQYTAVDGLINDWHRVHLAGLARGGAGLLIVEATAVSPEGRITPGCAGLWNDAQAQAFAPVVASIKAAGAVPGIQIGHAGRKASANVPWEGDDHIGADDSRGWSTIAPSAIAFGAHLPKVPKAMTLEDIARVREDFVAAAKRARDAGFEWLELHFAHGYLGQSFFSTHSNQRDDAYGGSLDNRSRFLLETLAAVRKVWPEHLPLTARFGVIEYDGRDEETLAELQARRARYAERQRRVLDADCKYPMGTCVPCADRRACEEGSGFAGVVGLGHRYAGTREPIRRQRSARSGDGRPRTPRRPALAVPCRTQARHRTPFVDAAGAVCALARALRGELNLRVGAAHASRAAQALIQASPTPTPDSFAARRSP